MAIPLHYTQQKQCGHPKFDMLLHSFFLLRGGWGHFHELDVYLHIWFIDWTKSFFCFSQEVHPKAR
jgi:hypothetical protein